MRALGLLVAIALGGCGSARPGACSPAADACLARCPDAHQTGPGQNVDPAGTQSTHDSCAASCERYCR